MSLLKSLSQSRYTNGDFYRQLVLEVSQRDPKDEMLYQYAFTRMAYLKQMEAYHIMKESMRFGQMKGIQNIVMCLHALTMTEDTSNLSDLNTLLSLLLANSSQYSRFYESQRAVFSRTLLSILTVFKADKV